MKKELPALQKAYDFCKEVLPRASKLPREAGHVGMETYGPDKYWDVYHVDGLWGKVLSRAEMK